MIKFVCTLILPPCAAALATACGDKPTYEMGTYGYDSQFMREHNIEFVELTSQDGLARVMLVPNMQGRVMTTTAGGEGSDSYGWINYKFIESGVVSGQFNPVGGEERFWFGPEGGSFSLYFAPGIEQVYDNWVVPSVIDTENFEVAEVTPRRAVFTKKTRLTNASSVIFDVGIERTVTLLDEAGIRQKFGVAPSPGMNMVAYTTDNIITNIGTEAWTRQGGLISVWLLGMFNPTPTTTVFIPYDKEATGTIVNDTYFGKVPADRLIVDQEQGVIYFKIDGLHRSKIGLPGDRATAMCGSYDSSRGVLTLLARTLPDSAGSEKSPVWLNGQWGEQEDPFAGDAINSYNDGPIEDGSVMGPFYEIENSSPGAELTPGEHLTHSQSVIHIQGTEEQLEAITGQLFGLTLNDISSRFQ